MLDFQHITIGQMAGNGCTLAGFRKALHRILDKLDRMTPQIDVLCYKNEPGTTPGYLRHLSSKAGPSEPPEIQFYYGRDENQRRMEVSIYLAPELGHPSYTVAETAASDCSNVPPEDAPIEGIKALVRRWLRIAGDPAPEPIAERIAYSDLPRLLSVLAQAQHGTEAAETWPMLSINQVDHYGRLIIGQAVDNRGFGSTIQPVLTQPVLDHLAARVPLELQIYKKVSKRPNRRPEDGLPKHVIFTLGVPGDYDFEWNFYPTRELADLSMVDQLKMLRPLAHLGPDFMLPFVQPQS